MNLIEKIASASIMAGLAAVAAPALAQDFPEEPISIVVNWPAGGGQDTAARLIADWASKKSPVPILVTNVTGAGGANGIRHAAEAAPDGYTIGIAGSSIVARSYLNENATPLDQIDPLVFFGPDPGALEVNAATGIETLDDFLAKLKAEPGSLLNGNDAPGGSSDIFASLLQSSFDVTLTKVPYQGYSPTVAAMMSGEIDSATLPVHQFAEQHAAGSVRILAVAAEERHFMAPDVPTFAELGHDFIAGDWRALFLPLDVPAERKEWLEALFMETMSDPDFIAAAQTAGFVVTPKDAAETSALIAASDSDIHGVLVEAGLVPAASQ